MRGKERSYPRKPAGVDPNLYYSSYDSITEVCHPEYLLFFRNLRYIVKGKFNSFNEFSRLINATYHINLTSSRVAGYEKGFYKTAQYNWLKAISVFLGADVHEMMQVDFAERDERASSSV